MDNPLYIAVTKEYLPLTRNGDRLAPVTDTVATVKVSDKLVKYALITGEWAGAELK